MQADEPPPPPPERPLRALDTVSLEGLDDLVDADSPDRAHLKSRDFPELNGLEVASEDINVVLFDSKSVDSFAACYAARVALGESSVYEGVTRGTTVDDLAVEVRGKVVAMLGISWSPEALHDLVAECEWLLIFETHESVARELEQFYYPSAVKILEFDMGAGAMAWNFFFPGDPVPALLRAIEDAELGRHALRGADAFADGFEHSDFFEPPFGECETNEPFEEFELRLDRGGRSTIDQVIEEGLQKHAPAIQEECSKATAQYTVRTLRAFPAWRCAFLELSPQYAGRVAEHLAAHLAATETEVQEHRSFAAVFEATDRRVRVVLRSPPGGPDVSEIAAMYEGCGHPTKGFFSVPPDEWDELWVPPETVLWNTEAKAPHCLTLQRGDLVTIARRGERFRDAPFDQWSWGYKCADASEEGWIPTLAHTLLVATRNVPSSAQGIMEVHEGDLLVAQGQRGQYLWGRRLQPRFGREGPKGWFPHIDSTWQPVHATSVEALFAAGGG